jgi:uncharacterized iron-regulated membrane protein
MSSPASTLKLVRQLHLYLGVFIAPAVLFFAFTGALQSLSLHETTPGRTYKPAAWIVTLAQLHKKQTTIVPVRKPRPEASTKADTDKLAQPADPSPKTSAPEPPRPTHLPMKIFVVLVAIGLASSTLSGIFMAYKYTRGKLAVIGLLLAGFVVPLLLLTL